MLINHMVTLENDNLQRLLVMQKLNNPVSTLVVCEL